MSFPNFDLLPAELKLQIIYKSDAITISNLLRTSKLLRELAFYVVNDKIASLTGLKSNIDKKVPELISSTRKEDVSLNALSGLNLLYSMDNNSRNSVVSSLDVDSHTSTGQVLTTERTNNILISLFSPQNVESKVELYETKCLSNPSTNNSTVLNSSPLYGNSNNSNSADSLLDMMQHAKSNNEKMMVSDNNLTQINDMLTKIDQKEDIYSTSKFHNNNINENVYSCFELGSLVKTRNPFTKKITSVTSSNTTSSILGRNLPMNLLIDEDSNHVKLTIQLSLANQVTVFDKTEIFKTEWASDDCKFLISQKRKYGLMFKLKKGDEVPPRSPYDYEAITNYYLDIDHFMINNCYLLKCVEDAGLVH